MQNAECKVQNEEKRASAKPQKETHWNEVSMEKEEQRGGRRN